MTFIHWIVSYWYIFIVPFVCVFADSGVEEKLETLQGPVAVGKVVGESVLLPCVMKGSPVPVIRWTLNDRPINER